MTMTGSPGGLPVSAHRAQDFDREAGVSIETEPRRRKPGELLFAYLMLALAMWLFWLAWGIPGARRPSAPGTLPMAVCAIMVLSALVFVVRTHLTAAPHRSDSVLQRVAPPGLVPFVGLAALYVLALDHAGFVLSSLVFLTVAISILDRRHPLRALVIAFGAVVLVYLLFRMVFQVLLPEGFVPERQWLAIAEDWLRGRNR